MLRKYWRGQNVNVDKKKELNWDNKKGIEIIGNKKGWNRWRQESQESLELKFEYRKEKRWEEKRSISDEKIQTKKGR